MIARERRRQKTDLRYSKKRTELKKIIKNPNSSDEERAEAQIKLQKLPRDALLHFHSRRISQKREFPYREIRNKLSKRLRTRSGVSDRYRAVFRVLCTPWSRQSLPLNAGFRVFHKLKVGGSRASYNAARDLHELCVLVFLPSRFSSERNCT